MPNYSANAVQNPSQSGQINEISVECGVMVTTFTLVCLLYSYYFECKVGKHIFDAFDEQLIESPVEPTTHQTND